MVSSIEKVNSHQLKVERVTRSAGEVDLMRSYLRDIGRVPVLTHEQEITFGRRVQELVSLESLEADLESLLLQQFPPKPRFQIFVLC